jgi:hypothetical protein
LAALFATPSGVVGGLVFGRRWKSRLLYVIPSIVTALRTVDDVARHPVAAFRVLPGVGAQTS